MLSEAQAQAVLRQLETQMGGGAVSITSERWEIKHYSPQTASPHIHSLAGASISPWD